MARGGGVHSERKMGRGLPCNCAAVKFSFALANPWISSGGLRMTEMCQCSKCSYIYVACIPRVPGDRRSAPARGTWFSILLWKELLHLLWAILPNMVICAEGHVIYILSPVWKKKIRKPRPQEASSILITKLCNQWSIGFGCQPIGKFLIMSESWIKPGGEIGGCEEGREVEWGMERQGEHLVPKEMFCKAIILSPSGR